MFRISIILLFFALGSYICAPQLITKTCSPWILKNGDRVSFECRGLTPWSLDLVDILFNGSAANVHVDGCSLDFDLVNIYKKGSLDRIRVQKVTLFENSPLMKIKASASVPHQSLAETPDFPESKTPDVSQKTWQEELKHLNLPIQVESLSISEVEVIPLNQPKVIIDSITGNVTTSGADLEVQVQSFGVLELSTQLSWTGNQLNVLAQGKSWAWNQYSNVDGQVEANFSLDSNEMDYQVKSQCFISSDVTKPNWVVVGQGNLQAHHWSLYSDGVDGNTPTFDVSWNVDQKNKVLLEKYGKPLGHIGWDSASIWYQPSIVNDSDDLKNLEETSESSPHRYTLRHDGSALSTVGSIAEMSQEGVWMSSGFDYSIPLTPEAGQGWLRGSLDVVGVDVLDVSLTLSAKQQSYTIAGNIKWQKFSLPEIPVRLEFHSPFESNSTKPWVDFSIQIPKQELSIFTEEFGLPAGHLSVQVDGHVEVSFSLAAGLVERAEFSWKDGFYSSEDMSTMMAGLSGKIHTPSLSQFKTGSAQVIRWKKISAHGFTVDQGELFWQWEQEQRLFVESMRAHWCGGLLNLQPFRVQLPLDALKIVLFCERVELDQLLKQFQVGDVEGDGDLGGRLSVELDGDKISFDDAYLYTAPAREGSLKILEVQGLDQAMGQNQLQLVRESLKDYRYRWAKISFDAEGEDLVLKLEMDGRPAGLLPFRFDPNTAQFIHDPAAPGVDLKGLKLNTNFRSSQLWPMILSSIKWAQKMEIGAD